MSFEILQGDCIEVMAEMEEASVDAVVTDPPYGLSFMGKAWDTFNPVDMEKRVGTREGTGPASNVYDGRSKGRTKSAFANLGGEAGSYDFSLTTNRRYQAWCKAWAKEVFRVLKPGGHLLASCGTRTYHRLAAGVEDAGFEIRDSLLWLYGSGFPKSLSLYRRMSPCPSIESAPHAVRLSEWLPLESSEGRAPTALALVEIQPEGELAVVMETGRAAGSPALTVTSLSDLLAAGMSSSIESSWSECSGAPWSQESKSTIATAIKAITDRRTWRSSALPTTRATTPEGGSSPAGCECRAATVASRSTAGRWRSNGTRRLIATESVTSPLAALRPLGTALKPSHEPIVVARKPLIGTVAENVLEYGTGGINVDGCRIGSESTERPNGSNALGVINDDGWEPSEGTGGSVAGRWPANVVLSHLEECEAIGTKRIKATAGGSPQRELTSRGYKGGGIGQRRADDHEFTEEVVKPGYADDDGTETVEAWNCAPGCPVAELDAQSGVLQSGSRAEGVRSGMDFHGASGDGGPSIEGSSGGAARFFYQAKTSRAEREAGLDGFDLRTADPYGEHRGRRMGDKSRIDGRPAKEGRNHHPTVKPMNLMRWLVRLVTPPGGACLDPFLGSGSTGAAAVLEGFDFIGIEREPEYIAIAEARIAFWAQHEGREVKDVLGLHSASQREAKVHAERGQITLEEAIEEEA